MNAFNEALPYAQVKVGSEVRTLDGQKLGAVSELRNQYFKVQTPRWHGDYWLRSDSVRSVGTDQGVILNVPQSQVEGIKMVDIELLR